MNTFHRFLATGFLTALSVLYVGSALAEQVTGQPPQYYAPPPQYYYAEPQTPRPRSYGERVGTKALSGLINVSPASALEIPKSIINNTNAEGSNIVYGLTGGAIEGGLNTISRIMTGAVDLITFLVPTKPVTYPLYVWDDFDEMNTYGDIFRLDYEGNPKYFELPGHANSAQKIQRRP
ncbi:hypothetical protein DOJK_01629 [Patescibacteria group bacterium]|nr:hypothetical protein DOJK_01629 [Patescibacteria group bacterium]